MKYQNWFTIVEVMVVLTIVITLGTISFFAFEWYASESRDAKRQVDLGAIQNAMNQKKVYGVSVINMIIPVEENRVSNLRVGGWYATVWVDYDAGTPNRTLLWLKSSIFTDPFGKEFRIGVITRYGWKYQVSSILENKRNTIAHVVGNFISRIEDIPVLTSTGATLVMIQSFQDYWKIRQWDNVGCVQGIPVDTTVLQVSSSGEKVYLSEESTSNGCTELFLWNGTTPIYESDGLIDDFYDTGAVIHLWSTHLPY